MFKLCITCFSYTFYLHLVSTKLKVVDPSVGPKCHFARSEMSFSLLESFISRRGSAHLLKIISLHFNLIYTLLSSIVLQRPQSCPNPSILFPKSLLHTLLLH